MSISRLWPSLTFSVNRWTYAPAHRLFADDLLLCWAFNMSRSSSIQYLSCSPEGSTSFPGSLFLPPPQKGGGKRDPGNEFAEGYDVIVHVFRVRTSIHGGSCRTFVPQLPLWIELVCTHLFCFLGAILSYQRLLSMDESFSKKLKLMPSRAQRIRYSIQLDVEAGMKERLEGWKSKIQRVKRMRVP